MAAFVTCLTLGGTFLLFGWIFFRYPPKKINDWYGYRSKRAMRSQDAWDVANRLSPKLMMGLGAIFLLLAWLPWQGLSEGLGLAIVMGIMTLGIAGMMYLTEAELKDLENRRKDQD